MDPILSRDHAVSSIAEKTWRIDEFGLDACFLLEGSRKSLLIDTGSGMGDLKAVVESLTRLPYDVVATHGHLDHMGGRGQFPTVHIHPADMELARSSTPESRRGYVAAMQRAYPRLASRFHLDQVIAGAEPQFVPVGEGFHFDLGDRVLELFETPGHTPGSISLLDAKTRLLFSGDSFNPIFLLLMPGADRRAVVQVWLEAAQRVWALRQQFDFLYGGHESPLGLDVLSDLIACARGILDGSVVGEETRIHLFEGMFAHYGKVVIAYDPQAFRFVR